MSNANKQEANFVAYDEMEAYIRSLQKEIRNLREERVNAWRSLWMVLQRAGGEMTFSQREIAEVPDGWEILSTNPDMDTTNLKSYVRLIK